MTIIMIALALPSAAYLAIVAVFLRDIRGAR